MAEVATLASETPSRVNSKATAAPPDKVAGPLTMADTLTVTPAWAVTVDEKVVAALTVTALPPLLVPGMVLPAALNQKLS